MKNLKTNAILLGILTITALAAGNHVWAQTPAPGIAVEFKLPMSSGSLQSAIVVWMPGQSEGIVILRSSTETILWKLTPTSPAPIVNPPIVNPPIIPPPPPKQVVTNFITVTESEGRSLSPHEQSILTNSGISYFAYTVAMVADKNPPSNSLKWIGRTAGKKYPYSFFASQDGVLAWEGPTPIDGEALIQILRSLQPSKPSELQCIGGKYGLKGGCQ